MIFDLLKVSEIASHYNQQHYKCFYLINFKVVKKISKFGTIIFMFSTVYVISITLKWEIKLFSIIKVILSWYRSTLTSSGSLTKLLFFLFVLQFFFTSETEFCNSKLLIVSAESLESKYSAMLTLPLPSLLVPTPFTKGGGGGGSSRTAQLSQKPLPP